MDLILSTLTLLQPKKVFKIKIKYISKKSGLLRAPPSIKNTQDSLHWDPQHFDDRRVGVFTT